MVLTKFLELCILAHWSTILFRRGVEFSHYGSCNNATLSELDGGGGGEDCQPESCRVESGGRGGATPRRFSTASASVVCGSDGNVYRSECQMRRLTCGQGVVTVDRRHCQTTAQCDAGCWRISRLTCGSDGKLYNNGCQMHRKNCG